MEYIKAIQNDDGSWHLEVLGVPYGSEQDRDSDNQFFNADTNTHEGKLPTIPAVYYHGRNEKGKQSDSPEYIGTAKHLRTDEKGVWYEVVLDKLNAYASRVWEAAKQGIARASSGSAPHLVRLGNNGHIREWPVFELSVFDTGEGRQPSNRHAVAMPMMKAIYEQAGIDVPEYLKGGAGSGNFGHEGRPGEVGGSSSDGGNSSIMYNGYDGSGNGKYYSYSEKKEQREKSYDKLRKEIQDAKSKVAGLPSSFETDRVRILSEKIKEDFKRIIGGRIAISKANTFTDLEIAFEKAISENESRQSAIDRQDAERWIQENTKSEPQPEAASTDAADNVSQKSNNGDIEMETNEIQKLIEDALKADREAQAEAVKAAAVRQAEIDAEVAKQVEAVKAEAAKGRRLPDFDGVAPYATKFNDSKFDNLSAGELSLGLEVLKANKKDIPAAAVKSLALKLISANAKTEGEESDLRYVKSSMPTQMLDEKYLKSAEIMATGDSGNGSDWIGTAYSSELWRSIRHSGGIVEKLPSVVIPDGYSSQYFPLEDADPTWYKVAETTAVDAVSQPTVSVTASKAGTGTKQITVAKAGARTLYSGELTEDSIVRFAPQLREQMVLSGQELMEALVINGDTETGATTNINDIGGTPAASDWFMILNGFRKLALVTNTANARSAGGALAIEDYLETMKLMGTAGIAAQDLSKLMFIVDPNVHFANMSLPEVKTRDVFSAATIENGFLKRAYGVEIFPSWQFHRGATGLKANSAGKVDLDTQGNNTLGAFLCVRPDQWKFAYKRRMTIESTRFASSDTYEIVALARFGLGYRDSEAAAISYNVGI